MGEPRLCGHGKVECSRSRLARRIGNRQRHPMTACRQLDVFSRQPVRGRHGMVEQASCDVDAEQPVGRIERLRVDRSAGARAEPDLDSRRIADGSRDVGTDQIDRRRRRQVRRGQHLRGGTVSRFLVRGDQSPRLFGDGRSRLKYECGGHKQESSPYPGALHSLSRRRVMVRLLYDNDGALFSAPSPSVVQRLPNWDLGRHCRDDESGREGNR